MGHKVLLADDSITVQKIVKLSLTEEGIEVIALGNGEQAVQQLEAIQPDLVMADVFMPGKDGYEVCEFVKSHPQFKHIPVILLVHAFEPFDPDRAKKVCADRQLTKPFQSIRTLVTTVQDLLATSQSSPPQAEATLAAEVSKVEVAPEPALSSMATFPVTDAPEEEVAVVSSFSPNAFANNEAGLGLEGSPMPEVALMPPLSSFDLPPQASLAETNLPVPGTDLGIAMELAKTDFLPPLELSVLPQTDWQAMPGAEVAHLAFDALALGAVSLAATPVVTRDVAEDVLDLSEVLSANLGNLPTAPGLSASFAPVNEAEAPFLAMLSSVAAEPESTSDAIAQSLSPVPESASLMDTFDLGVGQVTLETPVLTEESASPIEEVSSDPIMVPGTHALLPISEEMIEEIANRVIQRLSTQAIQEIAWEVVPEMAELLIRKQISQHPPLSH